MIEATCSACGTLNRIAETDVPMGAKFVNCASCKARVTLPASGGMLDLSDLPAPKARANPMANPLGTPPALPKAALNLDGDLPAPKAKATMGGGLPKPPPQNTSINLDDFLAPAEPDLPAPKARGGRMTDLPVTKPTEDILDLPAPKSARGVTDLPKASIPGLRGLAPTPGVTDLPTPKGVTDLPTPKGVTDLPGPRGGMADLPAPKGPAKSTVDLPMPKGAGASGLPAPKSGIDLPAPKGFFDDLPQPSKNQGAGSSDLPAPKGFFDDLPQVAKNQGSQGLPAPLGFFEDLPQKKKGGEAQPPAPKGYFENLPQRAKASSQDLTPVADDAMELDVKGQELDLAPSTPLSVGNYNDIDISKPSTPPSRHADANDRATQSGTSGQGMSSRSIGAGGDATLELEADPRNRTPQLAQKRKDEAGKQALATTVQKRFNKGLLAGIVAGVAVLGGGGFYMYRRHAASAEVQDVVDEELKKARTALVATEPGHWARAATAARKVLDADETNAEAFGIGAEASFAAALDEGAIARVMPGRKLIGEALAAGVSGAPIARAQALNAITMGQIDQAIAKLAPMVAGSKDGFVALYLGWAQSAKGDAAAAVAAFDQAAKINKALAVPAMYGRAKAKLAGGDIVGAHADFQSVVDANNKHIGGQVGLAASEPAAQQEADLLAIIQGRKDFAAADPRVQGQAWVLAGDAAMRGARLDAARERYKKALELNPNDVGALTGLAEVELKDGKIPAATEAIVKALAQAKDDPRAQIVAIELAIRQNKLDDADERIHALSERQPPLSPLAQAHLLVAKGHLLEVQHKDDAAVEAYVAAAKLAGDLDLGPTMAAVNKLVAMGQKARAAELLQVLETKAENDPSLALTLGNGYLQAGDYPNAEKWLRKASDARPTDADAMFQLGKAMGKNGQVDNAVAQLKKAMEIDPARSEIGLELARTYEDAGRNSDAGELYEKLLTNKDASLDLRGHAGRYYARLGLMEKAATQGSQILLADPANPAGNYLKGEGLLAEHKAEEARRAFKAAEQQDQDAQYLDAEGRALEELIAQTSETKWQDTALTLYGKAHGLAPKMKNPPAGMGRIYSARHEWKKALASLTEAWALDDKNGDVAFLIANAADASQDKASALSWFAKSQSLKSIPAASYRLGILYEEANNPKLASDALSRATRAAEAENKATGKPPTWLGDAYYRLGKLLYSMQDLHGAKEAWDRYLQQNPQPGVELNHVRELLNTALRNN